MAKEDFITEIKDNCYLIEGKWYSEGIYDHLIEKTISGEHLLLEYYQRVSEVGDKIMDKNEVWVFGADRGEFTPHCHILSDADGKNFNIEIHLIDFEAFRMKKPKPSNISWGNLPQDLHDRFMSWLNAPYKDDRFNTNAEKLFYEWDENNPTNTLKIFVKKHNLQDNIHPLLREYLYGNPLDPSSVVSSFFTVVLPLYQQNKKERERLHHIVDPINFAKEVGLPFEFNEYNATTKIRQIITDHEKLCYEMTQTIK